MKKKFKYYGYIINTIAVGIINYVTTKTTEIYTLLLLFYIMSHLVMCETREIVDLQERKYINISLEPGYNNILQYSIINELVKENKNY